jgi:hypothetical protein
VVVHLSKAGIPFVGDTCNLIYSRFLGVDLVPPCRSCILNVTPFADIRHATSFSATVCRYVPEALCFVYLAALNIVVLVGRLWRSESLYVQ